MIIFCSYNCVFTFIQNSQSLSFGIQLIILRKTGGFPFFGGHFCYLCSWETLQKPWTRQPGGRPDASRHLSVEVKPGWPSRQRAGVGRCGFGEKARPGVSQLHEKLESRGSLGLCVESGCGSPFPGLGTFPAVLTGPPSSAAVGHYARVTLTPCPWGSHPPARHPQVSVQMWVPPRTPPRARTAGATASLATLG